MKKIIFITLILQTNLIFSQSKKEEIMLLKLNVDSLKVVLENDRNSNFIKLQELNLSIENLKIQISSQELEINDATHNLNQKELEKMLLKVNIDSLKIVLENDRNSNFKKVQELNSAIENLKTQISSLELEVKDNTYNLNQKELENMQLKNGLNQNLTEISSLKLNLINKNDSLIIIYNELHKMKTSTQNTNSNFPENNYDLLIPKFINKEKYRVDYYKQWLENVVASNIDGDTSYITIKCVDYIHDVIDFTGGYPGSIDEETLNKKWANQYDLKYSNFGHLFEAGNCGWGTKKLTKIEFLGELNSGVWIKLTIKGGCGENDFSTMLVRVIKVINKRNTLYVDNFISLTQE